MKKNFLPLFTAPFTISGHKTIFYLVDKKVVVEAPRKLIQQLIILCDGIHTYEKVIQCLGKKWDSKTVKELLMALCYEKIIVDAQQIDEKWWGVVENPSIFSNHITTADTLRLSYEARKRHCYNPSKIVYSARINSALGLLLSQRQSIRSFSNSPVAFQNIIDILWSAYGKIKPQKDGYERRTVPSAGALYPLVIHIALFKQTADLQPAVYSIYLGHSESIGFHIVSSDVLRFARAFLGHLMFGKAHGVIVISGSFRITGKKYGNRGMLYALLEAGHVAQNIHLAAVEHNVATVEIGGFVDTLLANAINLPKHYHPLTTVVFGKQGNKIQAEVLNSKMKVQWNIPLYKQYHPPFAIVSAKVLKERSWSNGRDVSPILAYTKAVAEAKEWTACGCIPMLTKARFIDLETTIDPRSIIKFHPTQYRLKGFPFKPFDEKIVYEWTKGYNERTGSLVYILANFVYFPYFPKTPYYTYANSSGVAAHPNRQKAVETSTLELVERDSFMIAYLTQLKFPTIHEQTLPESIKNRIRQLKKVGFRVWIKDYSLDLAPVVCVLAQSEDITYTPCAACSSFDIEYAVDHALMEVEALILSRFQKGPLKYIKPHEVVWPLDHQKLYGQRQYFHRADFLIRDQDRITFQCVGKGAMQSWQELLKQFTRKGWQLFTISLHLSNKYGGNGNLHIIRSIVPGMIPITFGYRQEPAGMERIYSVAKEFGNKQLTYQKLTKFPHPFA